MSLVGTRRSSRLGRLAHHLTGARSDYDDLLARVGEARVTLIGEASHGTHEFYRERIRLTQRLIEDRHVTVVAIEGDCPDAYRVNRYVLGLSDDANANDALGGFHRFPTWMWRNRDVLDFVEWLREFNHHRPPADQVRFYGLDLYSLGASIEAVVDYLEGVDPVAAHRARERYACFDHVGAEGQAYGYSLATGRSDDCEDEVVAQLLELRENSPTYLAHDGNAAQDEQFYAEQNARLVHNAETYYREMYRADVSSWNLRDRHMAGTLEAILAHFDRRWPPTRAVVWAHNSHVGDARTTDMAQRGEVNIGQLARERYGNDAFLIGMTTYAGEVTAASTWGGPTERKRVRPARPRSHEAKFHEAGVGDAWFTSAELANEEDAYLERAIGVIYRPDTELQSHYFHARLAAQFDALIHIERTSALIPLETTALWDCGEPAETFPSGL